MKKFVLAFALAFVALFSASRASAQTPAATPGQLPSGVTSNGVIGDVAAVDAASKQLFVKTDGGAVVVVVLSDATVYKRVPPGETTLGKAVDTTLSTISAGDRVFARGKASDDGKTVAARMVILMSKTDIEAKNEAERAEWRKRGIVGVVSTVNPQTKEITLQTRSAGGTQPVIIPIGSSVRMRRYAPDSIKFGDAKPSTFEELKVGDQLRAKGERTPDGARFNAEEIVTGSFRTVMGTITAVNAETNEIKINTMQGNQPLTVVVSRDSMIKRFPAEFAAMMAQRMGGGAPGAGAPGAAGASGAAGAGAAGAGGSPRNAAAASPQSAVGATGAGAPARTGGAPGGGAPGGGAPGGTPGAGAGGGMRMMGDPAEMLERLPNATLAELKPGSMIAVSSTVGADPARVTAIQLVSGIEALAQMMARPGGGGPGGRQPNLGTLNLGFGIGTP